MRKLNVSASVMALLCVVAMAGTGCVPPPTDGGDGNCTGICGSIFNLGGPSGVSPSPSGNGSDTLPPNSRVPIFMYGMSCPTGTAIPNNGSRSIPPGCTAFLTATPKGPDGVDLSPAVHGPNCAWSSVGVVDLSPATEAFNQDARCPGPGDSTVSAIVKNVTGSVGVTCLTGTAPRSLGAPVFHWFADAEGREAPASVRRDAIVRTLDRWEHTRDEAR